MRLGDKVKVAFFRDRKWKNPRSDPGFAVHRNGQFHRGESSGSRAGIRDLSDRDTKGILIE